MYYESTDESALPKKKIFTVSEITKLIKEKFEQEFGSVWIEGEVSNVSFPISGHCYLTLKDKDAQIRIVMFKYVNQQLRFKVENGLQVVCLGKLTVYAPRGEYQLVATHMEPKGLGALQLAFEQLKKKLEQEGLFEPAHKKSLPLLPQRIGIVTSVTGAAIRDILHVLDRRFNNLHIIVVPVKVQGDGAANDIAAAITMLNEYGLIDVMIVGRGGGSLEDLWAFNEEIVARAIYNSTIPIISAVGHEIDYTISDFVADMRAPTPSAAAEMVISTKEYLEEKIDVLMNALSQCVRACIDRNRQRFTTVRSSYFFRQPRALIENYFVTIDTVSQTLMTSISTVLTDRKHSFHNVCHKLEALNPLRVLARGYSVTYDDHHKPIVSIRHVTPSQKILTRVADGAIMSTVDHVDGI